MSHSTDTHAKPIGMRPRPMLVTARVLLAVLPLAIPRP
jgi:hypothetical protein